MAENLIPDWAKSENLRWAFWGWDPLPYYRRLGGKKEAFFGNNEWMEQWWERIYSLETVKKMADIGINLAITQFYKGAGLKFEKDLRDKLKPLVEMCHENGIKVMGYTQLGSLFYETLLAEQPECGDWAMRKYNGEKATNGYYRWRQCCNQPGLLDYMKKIIQVGYEEIGLDGFHFDNAVMDPCYCEICRDGFRKYLSEKIKSSERMWLTDFSHVEPPPPPAAGKYITDPLAQEWIRYCCEKGADNFGKLSQYVKSLNPELLVHANNGFPRYERWAVEFGINPYLYGKQSDLICAENVNFPGFHNGKLVTQIDAFRYGEAIGFQTLPASWLHEEKDGTIILPTTAGQAKLSVAEPIISGGCSGVNYALRTTGGSSLLIDNENIAEAVKNYIEFFDTHKHYYASAKTLAKVGVLHSFNSLTMGGHEVWMASSGMVLSLIGGNIPYKYILEEDLSELNDFTVIVLSNQMCLSNELCNKIIDFVRGGGKLYVSGNSGKYDENLLLRLNNAFAVLVGNPNVAFLPDTPEACPETNNCDTEHFDWLQTELLLPPRHKEVADSIRTLLAEDDFITVDGPPSVVVVPRLLPDGTLALHALNYDDKSTAKQVEINLRKNCFSGTEYTVYNLDKESSQIVMIEECDQLKIILRELETYQLVVI